jgi:formate-dependent nitrite reductase membrane component NrfD
MSISEMPWGIKLWFDLWCVGIASGAFLTAFIIDRLSGGNQRNLFRLAVCTGLIFALVGVILLLSHLGHILWFWHMFVTFLPESVLSLGGWILTGWLTVSGIMVVLWIAEYYLKKQRELIQKVTGMLSWVGFVLSVLLITYGGVLIATSSRPLWADTLLLPSLFIGSAMCNGIGWLILISLIANWVTGSKVAPLHWFINQFFGSSDWRIDNEVIAKMIKALVVVLAAELVILVAFAAWLWAVAREAFTQLISGEMALYFWIGLVFIGLVAPLLMLLMNGSKGVANRMAAAVVAISATLAVAGGLILRAVLLVSAQI